MIQPARNDETIAGFDNDPSLDGGRARLVGDRAGVGVVNRVVQRPVVEGPFLAAVYMRHHDDMGIAVGIKSLAVLRRDVEILLRDPIRRQAGLVGDHRGEVVGDRDIVDDHRHALPHQVVQHGLKPMLGAAEFQAVGQRLALTDDGDLAFQTLFVGNAAIDGVEEKPDLFVGKLKSPQVRGIQRCVAWQNFSPPVFRRPGGWDVS